jgi:hypothetical protein
LAGNAATATFKVTVSNPSPPPLTERFRNQGQCVSDGNANPDEGITRQAYQEAFVEEEEIEEPGVESDGEEQLAATTTKATEEEEEEAGGEEEGNILVN